jgi:hypothetical protein
MIINVPTGRPYFHGTKILDGDTYVFTFRWNTTSEKWYMDIDGKTNDVAIHGIACLGGKDLLKQHGYSELGKLWLIDELGQDEDPDFDSFGARHFLEYFPLD